MLKKMVQAEAKTKEVKVRLYAGLAVLCSSEEMNLYHWFYLVFHRSLYLY